MTTAPKYTILIVDDSAEDRQVYRRYLNKEFTASYKIIEAESGDEGLEQLTSIQPDLILLDYLLPDFNGLELIEELKKQLKRIPPIIMLTGQGNESVAVEAMKSGVKDYLVKAQLTAKTLTISIKNVLQQQHLQSLLTKNFQQQQLIAETALRIRQSLDLSETLNTTVKEVRLLLNCDRVVIYQFTPDMSGNIVAESVKLGWKRSLGLNIVDTCFKHQGTDRYERGEALAINNIHESGLSECHIKLLEKFQVKANAIVPILLSPEPSITSLWGLLIAHQCNDVRQWESSEVELLNKLAIHMSIAIQQAELLDNVKSELETRKKLEIELARRVQVLEASEDLIVLAALTGRVLWNNPRMKEIIGIAEEDMTGHLCISDYHPKWALDIVQNIGIPTAIQKGTWLGETAILTGENQEIPVSQLIIAHKSPEGNVEYLSTVIRNLSQQKQAENSLREKALELQWVNQQLLKTTSQLKKRNQELDSFAYVTSHDLKAPLRAIANLSTWLSEDLGDSIPEANQQQLQLMQSRVKRMDGLIQGLLEYSRVDKKNAPCQIINVADILQEVIDSLSPPSGLEIVVASNMPTLKTESILLQQVFANLMSNAIKYHPQQKGKITVSVLEKTEFYEFAVADDGLGIDPRYHNRIFTIFQTLQARDKFESTGIGLSIVKKIVEGQGGKVWLNSQVGEGAIFYFTWYK